MIDVNMLRVVKGLEEVYRKQENIQSNAKAFVETTRKLANVLEILSDVKTYVDELNKILSVNINKKDLDELIQLVAEFSKFIGTVSKLARIMESVENFDKVIEDMKKFSYLLSNLETITQSLAKIEEEFKDINIFSDNITENLNKIVKLAELLDSAKVSSSSELVTNITINKLAEILEKIDILEALVKKIEGISDSKQNKQNL